MNSTFSGNRATGFGGAIAVEDGALTVVNSTLTGNRSDNDNSGAETGGGFDLLAGVGSGTAQFFNTIIAGNFVGTGSTADDLGGGAVLAASANNLIGNAATAGGLTHGTNGNIVGNAGSSTLAIASILNTTLADNGGSTRTHALVAGSLALNAGDNTRATTNGQVGGPALTTDQRSGVFTRIFNTTVDIGAYEAQAVTFVVDNNTADLDDGVYTAGNLTLREAVNLANADFEADTITFANGLGPIDLTVGQLTLSQNVLIDGGGDVTVRRSSTGGTPNFRIFEVKANVTAELRGLTIANGKSGQNGGGILNEGTLTVSQSTLSGNSSDGGFGGGIFNFGTLTVSQSTLSGNSTPNFGGGIHNAGTLTVSQSTLSGNSATFGSGGGINNQGTLTVSQSTLSGNFTATSGGGIDNQGTLTVSQSTLSGNSADNHGGGIFNLATLTIINSTLAGNRADSEGDAFGTGGGIHTFNAGFSATTLHNTIVAGNFVGTGTAADDLAEKNVEAGSSNNLIGNAATAGGLTHGTNGNIVGNAGAGTLAIASILNTTLANNGGPTRTHALVAGSAALNAGSNARATTTGQIGGPALTTDQRGTGFDRIVGTAVDIGAVEHQGGIITTQIVQAGTKATDLRLNVTDVGGNARLTIVLTAGNVKYAVQLVAGVDTFIVGQTLFNGLTKGLNVQLLGGNDEVTVNGTGASGQTIGLDLGLGDDRYIIAGAKTVFTLTDAGGVDTIDFSNQPKKAQIDLAKLGSNQSLGSNGNKAIVTGQFENVVGGNFGNKLLGNAANNTLTGGAGRDTLDGRDGNDILIGGLSDDKLLGGNGNDELDGGGGKDKLTDGTGNDIFIGGSEDDQLTSGGGFDLLFGGLGKDKLTGAKTGNSLLVGGTTDHDANFVALRLLLAEWSGGNPLATRIANLRAGVGTGSSVRLKKTAVATVADTIPGETLQTYVGNNWVFVGTGDNRRGLLPTDVDE